MLHDSRKVLNKRRGALVMGSLLSACLVMAAYANKQWMTEEKNESSSSSLLAKLGERRGQWSEQSRAAPVASEDECKFDYVTQGGDWAVKEKAERCNWQCAENEQSPIDLSDSIARPAYLMSESDEDVRAIAVQGVGPQAWTLINNGHTLKFAKTDGSPYVRFEGGIMDGQYCVAQVHFHWPSEHTFNGEHVKLEAHFVSFKCDLGDLGSAVAAPGRNLAVLGVGFAVADNERNNALKPLVQHLKELREPGHKTAEFEWDPLSLLLPLNNEQVIGDQPDAMNPTVVLRDFFAYDGSLTTPGCNQVVRWHVLKDYRLVSMDLARVFYSHAVMDDHEHEMVNNYRQVVPNVNPVYSACSEAQGNQYCSVVLD